MGIRPHKIIIRPDGAPYMRRWHLIPRNPWFNVYLHNIMGSDYAKDPHDHPWAWFASIVLRGAYVEEIYRKRDRGVRLDRIPVRKAGRAYVAGRGHLHRVRVLRSPVWTLFITGHAIKEWGFHTSKGWVRKDQYLHGRGSD